MITSQITMSSMIATVQSISGWVVVQEYVDSSLDWNLPWSAYREGFGTLGSNYWIGLEKYVLPGGAVEKTVSMQKTGFDFLYVHP